jgi:hypothetical protein
MAVGMAGRRGVVGRAEMAGAVGDGRARVAYRITGGEEAIRPPGPSTKRGHWAGVGRMAARQAGRLSPQIFEVITWLI